MFPGFTPDQSLYPFESRWLDTSKGRVHYIDEGAGPTVIFVHGSPTWSFMYRGVVERLRDRYRCIAVDLLGFGLSERPAGFGYSVVEHTAVLREFVTHLGIEDYIVVAHDWGGPIGLGAALGDPSRLRGVALTNTVLWPVDPIANRMFSAAMSTTFMRRRILHDNLLVERFLLPAVRDVTGDDDRAHYRGVFPDAAARAALAVAPVEIRRARPLLAALESDVAQTLRDVPAVAIWGMKDMVFRPRHCLPRLRTIFSDLEVVELNDVAHFVPEQAPAAVAAAIEDRF